MKKHYNFFLLIVAIFLGSLGYSMIQPKYSAANPDAWKWGFGAILLGGIVFGRWLAEYSKSMRSPKKRK